MNVSIIPDSCFINLFFIIIIIYYIIILLPFIFFILMVHNLAPTSQLTLNRLVVGY